MDILRLFRATVVVGAVALMAVPQTVFAQRDPALGTWKLNVAKSKYDPGPAPKSTILVIEAAGQGVKVRSTGLGADGYPAGLEYTASYDGADYPVKLTGSQDYDTVSLKRVDAYTAEGTRKKAGQIVQIYTREVSKDGKTLTVRTKGVNARRQTINNVAVFEK